MKILTAGIMIFVVLMCLVDVAADYLTERDRKRGVFK